MNCKLSGIPVAVVLSVATVSAFRPVPTQVKLTRFASVSVRRAGEKADSAATAAAFYRPRVSLRHLIDFAYGTTRARTAGGPEWMDDIAWAITGRAGVAKPRYVDLQQMVRALLVERFHLSASFEDRPVSALLVKVDKMHDRPQLRRAAGKVDCEPFLNGDRALIEAPSDAKGFPLCGPSRAEHVSSSPIYHFRSAPLTAVARDLEIMLNHVVVWSAPPSGLFDVDFATPPGYSNREQSPDIDSFMDALELQFGATCEVRTLPTRILIVHDATKPLLDGR